MNALKQVVTSILMSAGVIASATNVQNPEIYEIDVPPESRPIRHGHLDLGGSNPRGDTLSVNSAYIELNDRPFFPIVGEFHYARYPADRWDTEIRKMKAGGINVVATYVFWNVHERKEGVFDWTGDLNLRRFIELCAKNDVSAIVRMGPFDHGEMRNGGLPDWLYGRPFEVRSNDPGYLDHVDRLYRDIAEQIQGLLYKDGGPVIGVQLENEFQHSAAPWELNYPGAVRELTVAERDTSVTQAGAGVGDDYGAEYGSDHMANLKTIARRHGIDVPLYTATGWGNAAIVEGDSLPVTAGYAYPFWAPPEPSPFYLYKDIHDNPDYSPVSFDPSLYPSIPAELGSGIVATWRRRPLVDPDSVAPMIVRTVGSGSNGIGYYMYHGGSTPVFDHFYSEESSGVPKINYDFQAPIGEYGQVRSHHRTLNTLHLFLESFGERLAPMTTTLPETNASITPDDTTTLRYAVRSKGASGFVFMHNFQDHLSNQPIRDVALRIGVENDTIAIPNEGGFDLPVGAFAILPFNMDCAGVPLRYATVQPLSILEEGGITRFVFWSNPGMPAELAFSGEPSLDVDAGVDLSSMNGLVVARGQAGQIFSIRSGKVEFLVIPKEMADEAWSDGRGGLLFSSATLLPRDGYLDVMARDERSATVQALPKRPRPTGAGDAVPAHPSLSAFEVGLGGESPGVSIDRVSDRKFSIRLNGSLNEVNDLFLELPYVGDRGMAFVDGHLVADHFYYGRPWEISLKRFADRMRDDEMVLMFFPMHEQYEYMIDLEYSGLKPDFGANESYLSFGEFATSVERRATVAWAREP